MQSPFDTLALVVIMSRASSEEVLAATERRNEIINALLEVLTGPVFSTKELQRLRFVSEIFAIAPLIEELCASASTIEGRTELALAAAMCALNITMDSDPPAPSQRVIERREAREAEKQFKESLAGKVAVKPGKP
jgi:hypothetical protein